ncbi:hypothetical protein EVAR_5633_1 [Eumeta japonica]|uniref:Uncharacterized protein n=1 Tax=Eumeta variegata TaxID=151549 RepID=A0A4C1T850_EUMVA|nr:hypothetical protein EVAR_5633_1 [Eumeta japonica]
MEREGREGQGRRFYRLFAPSTSPQDLYCTNNRYVHEKVKRLYWFRGFGVVNGKKCFPAGKTRKRKQIVITFTYYTGALHAAGADAHTDASFYEFHQNKLTRERRPPKCTHTSAKNTSNYLRRVYVRFFYFIHQCGSANERESVTNFTFVSATSHDSPLRTPAPLNLDANHPGGRVRRHFDGGGSGSHSVAPVREHDEESSIARFSYNIRANRVMRLPRHRESD